MDHADVAVYHPLAQPIGIREILFIGDTESRAEAQRREYVAQQRIMGKARKHREAVGFTQWKLARVPFEKVCEWTMRPNDALGSSRGSRREGYVSHRIRGCDARGSILRLDESPITNYILNAIRV